jgi:hypothetical protein
MIMNKIINKIFPILTLAFALSSLTACLTDSDYENGKVGINPSNNKNYVEVHLTTSDNTNTVSRSYDAIHKDTTINLIPVHLTSGNAASDVTITYQVLDTLSSPVMKSFVNDDGFVVVPSTILTVLNTSNKVVIKAGTSTGYIQVKFNPDNLIGHTYVFGVKITAVSDPKYTISNLNVGFVKMGTKNMYDGEYSVKGTMSDVTNSAYSGYYPADVHLITQDGTSVAYYDLDLGNYGHLFLTATGGLSYYGSFAPVFKFNADNTVQSVVNIYGQPASNTRSAQLDPAGINKYDPATKTLSVSYWMNQPSVIPAAPNHRVHFVEVFTYVGPK